MVRLSDRFSAYFPTGRAINPYTKTNWEGTGVKPGVEVGAEQAPKVAHVMALKKLLEACKDPMLTEAHKQTIRGVEAAGEPATKQ